MSFQEKLQHLKNEMNDLITTNKISFLRNLDKRIELNKTGKFSYHTSIDLMGPNSIWTFIQGLEEGKIYAIIPLLSKNATPDEPYIVLSQTFLITKYSNHRLISSFISEKLTRASELYDIDYDNNYKTTLKYKEVKID